MNKLWNQANDHCENHNAHTKCNKTKRHFTFLWHHKRYISQQIKKIKKKLELCNHLSWSLGHSFSLLGVVAAASRARRVSNSPVYNFACYSKSAVLRRGCQTEGSGIGGKKRRKTRSLVETFCQFESSCLFNNVQVCLARLEKRGHKEEDIVVGSSTGTLACI